MDCSSQDFPDQIHLFAVKLYWYLDYNLVNCSVFLEYIRLFHSTDHVHLVYMLLSLCPVDFPERFCLPTSMKKQSFNNANDKTHY